MATTRHLVDPELVPLLDQFPPLQLTREALPEIRSSRRQVLEAQRALWPAFPDIDVSERFLPGPAAAPDVRVLLYQPKNAPRPMPGLVWIHGGGYVMGSADADDLQVKTM